MNTISMDTHGYIASISFLNDDIKKYLQMHCFISYLLK